MKCLDDYHTYELDTAIDETMVPGSVRPILRFYEIRRDGTKINGVTNEEVLKMLIHRIEKLNEGKYKCPENNEALFYLGMALGWFRTRTRNREKRGVEGTLKP